MISNFVTGVGTGLLAIVVVVATAIITYCCAFCAYGMIEYPLAKFGVVSYEPYSATYSHRKSRRRRRKRQQIGLVLDLILAVTLSLWLIGALVNHMVL